MKSVLKENHRYIGIIVVSEGSVDRQLLQSVVKIDLLEKIGEITFAKADPKLVYASLDYSSAIIRCVHTEADAVKAGLALITHAGQNKIHLMPIFTSGTILKCKIALKRDQSKH